MEYEKKFREDHPETVGETDREFDKYNYIEWIDAEHKKLLEDREILYQRSLKDIGLREKLNKAIEALEEMCIAIKSQCDAGHPVSIIVSNRYREAQKILSQLKDNQEKDNEM